ncbi:MAG: fructose-bisphosphate aldolase B [Amphiamblys sp. WSBS2006]|nr:MAG: fructose-bisphosphate aldolase B [Amphiamblys sp. WSBS2006]
MYFPRAAKNPEELKRTAREIVESGKGILAADESVATVQKRFSGINLENNAENRIRYRELMVGAVSPEYIGGIILHEETFNQKTSGGVLFPDAISGLGIKVGIKVDKGVVSIPTGETTTQGLDDLGKRCAEYYARGARFAKWRCTLKITSNTPTRTAITENATVLGRYAAICQESGLVPIVEPEILMDGDHTLERAMEVFEDVVSAVYRKLSEYKVMLEGTLLKPNMVCPGQDCKTAYSAEQIAAATLACLQRTVPPAVPGITFLSGGQSEKAATENLNAINNGEGQKPWRLTFSYARALQGSVLAVWEGKDGNTSAARELFLRRCAETSRASRGLWKGDDGTAQTENMFTKDYSY